MTPAALALALFSGAVLAAPLPPERPAVTVVAGTAADEMLCRDPRLMGDPRPDIIDVGALACGIDDPVRITSVAGIRISPPVLVGCPTARRLADWLTGIAEPEARAHLAAGIAEVTTMGGYACRAQNNTGRWRSEHARGRAIDIGGFVLSNGGQVTVAGDWGETPAGAFLREIWRQGCGPFSTVLGPDADRHHRDHLHLDTAPRDGEPFCQ